MRKKRNVKLSDSSGAEELREGTLSDKLHPKRMPDSVAVKSYERLVGRELTPTEILGEEWVRVNGRLSELDIDLVRYPQDLIYDPDNSYDVIMARENPYYSDKPDRKWHRVELFDENDYEYQQRRFGG